MTLIQIIVTITGLSLAAFEVWFFLFSKKKARFTTAKTQVFIKTDR
ncbi:hypothetical protein H8E88_34250 [candidate division KSB1 bacterium]|nr:hypothetical protein [candidate division KSB1 bacterium]MBL7093856.1 hypothetical protein [candidate division KSB1 bacterium]